MAFLFDPDTFEYPLEEHSCTLVFFIKKHRIGSTQLLHKGRNSALAPLEHQKMKV